MQSLYRFMAMVALVLWLPATSQCMLEHAGLLPDVDCCGSKGSVPADKSPDGSVCCTLGSGIYKTADGQTIKAPTLNLVSDLAFDLANSIEADRAPFDLESPSPPELPGCWQFFFRTALAPRAPSVLS